MTIFLIFPQKISKKALRISMEESRLKQESDAKKPTEGMEMETNQRKFNENSFKLLFHISISNFMMPNISAQMYPVTIYTDMCMNMSELFLVFLNLSEFF